MSVRLSVYHGQLLCVDINSAQCRKMCKQHCVSLLSQVYETHIRLAWQQAPSSPRHVKLVGVVEIQLLGGALEDHLPIADHQEA